MPSPILQSAKQTPEQTPNQTPTQTPAPSRLIWTALILLCLIAAAAAIRRIVAISLGPSTATPELSTLDHAFAARSTLTLIHIVPALAFVILLPAWFSRTVRAHTQAHRRITIALFLLGAIIGITALLLAGHPVGGINESAASVLYDSLFLFSLGRAALLFHRGNLPLYRNWMMRAIAVLLGIATTRPIMGFFFATERLTHLTPLQFFGTAFWIGFSVTYIAGEAYLRSHPPIINPGETQ